MEQGSLIVANFVSAPQAEFLAFFQIILNHEPCRFDDLIDEAIEVMGLDQVWLFVDALITQ